MIHPSNPPFVVRTSERGDTRVSRTFTERMGLTGDDLAQRPFLDWIHPDDHAAARPVLEAGHGRFVARHRTADDAWCSFEWRVKGDAAGLHVLGQLHDDEPAELPDPSGPPASEQESLGRMLERMARVVESKNPGMRCSILLVDKSGSRVTVGAGPSLPAEYNAAVEGLQIGPRVGSCGTAAYWNVPVVVEDIARDPLWGELRETAALAGVAACWSQPVRSASGDVLGAMALYDDKPGAPAAHQMAGLEIAARMVGLAIERERLEAKLRESAKVEAVGVLAGGLAHDFNNLLAVVLGNAELAMMDLDEDSARFGNLQKIVSATDSATALCNQMLAYAGRGVRSIETVDCSYVIEDLSDLLRVIVPKKVSLTYRLAEDLGVVGDRSQLRQVFMNLITNAAEAIGDAAGNISVRTQKRTLTEQDIARSGAHELVPGDHVEIEVVDDGCGMTPATQAKIFDPFFSTKGEGRGLGLAALTGIVKSHEGALLLESQPGAGTKFTVLLPWVPLAHESNGVDVRGEAAPERRILVVDDEPGVAEVVSGMLRSEGMQVVVAHSGVRAIEIFRREVDAIDCVLLDLSMPELGGEEVFEELRKIRADVPVVLSSGFTEQEVLDRFQGVGLTGVVQKPARRAILVSRICEAIGSGAVHRGRAEQTDAGR